jgi:hypothetical protein
LVELFQAPGHDFPGATEPRLDGAFRNVEFSGYLGDGHVQAIVQELRTGLVTGKGPHGLGDLTVVIRYLHGAHSIELGGASATTLAPGLGAQILKNATSPTLRVFVARNLRPVLPRSQ